MGVADNRKTCLRFYDAFNRGDLDAVIDDLAPDFVDHEVPTELGLGQGRDAVLAYLDMFRGAFPDIHFEALDVIAEDDLVAARVRVTGTHDGEFMGVGATGQHIDIEIADFIRFDDDGQAVEHWGATDNLEIMQQLGVLPESIGG